MLICKIFYLIDAIVCLLFALFASLRICKFYVKSFATIFMPLLFIIFMWNCQASMNNRNVKICPNDFWSNRLIHRMEWFRICNFYVKSFELAAYRAFGPLLLASGMACNGLVKVGDICRTRGYIVVQRDIYLSDKGTFICRTRGHLVKPSLWPH